MTHADATRARVLLLQLAARYGLDPGKHPAIREILEILGRASDAMETSE